MTTSNNTQLPEGWACATLGEITKNVSIKNADKKVEHVVSVTKHRGIVNSLDFFKKQVYSKELSTYKIIKRGQFAYATIHLDEGSIGFLADYDEAILSPMYTVFEAKKSRTDLEFLFIILKSERLLNIYNHVGLGSINRRKSIPYSIFAKIEISLPPLHEQRKIAKILSTVDEKIAVIDEQLAQTQELKKGLMQRMLTRGIGHNAFKDSPLGQIPESWEVSLLDSVAKRGSGHTPSKSVPEYYGGEIKWVSLGDSHRLDNGWIKETKTSISALGIKNSSAVLHPKGTVLLSRDAGVGKSAVMYEAMAVSQHFITWNCGPKLNNWFLYYFLQHNKPYFERIAAGSTIKTIGLPFFKKLTIPVPPIMEQELIAEILTTVDDKLQILTDKKAQYQELKRGLMQQLLTGQRRVRVVQQEEALA